MSSSTKRVLYSLLAIAILIVLPLYAFKVYAKTDYTDFFVYYRAASRAKNGLWDQVYSLGDGASPYRYLPFLLPLFRPFASLPLREAQLLWYFFQFFCFGFGFLFLYRSAKLVSEERAGVATALSVFFVLRFGLDCFTIGQSSSLMFLGYCIGLYGFMREDYFLSGSGVFLPMIFKVGPGISYLLYPFSKFEKWIRSWLAPLFWIAVLSAITILWAGGIRTFTLLLTHWRTIVASDDQYYDASHYGSQAIKSFLLRTANSGWISTHQAHLAWFGITALGCVLILAVWALRRARSVEGRGLLFALGVFPYLWFMPETFKYSLTMLALPMVLLFVSKRRTRLASFAIVFGFLTLSLAGKDLMPDSLFFGLQRASIPLLATFFIGAAILQGLFRETVDFRDAPLSLPRPWEELPHEGEKEGVSVLIPLSEKYPEPQCLAVISELEAVLKSQFGTFWEMIWIVPENLAQSSRVTRLRELARKFSQSKIVFSRDPGRGACLREGFLASSGRWIYLYRLEQPVGVEFFENAMREIRTGAELVRANRRDPETRFLIPVRYLKIAYRRHRLGMLFNRIARWSLPGLLSTDTHSGHLVLTRKTATQIFVLQTTGDFLFDLEISVISRAQGFREIELPIHLYLFEEKSGERILSEIVSIFTGLPKLRRRYQKGCYAPLKRTDAITADDWGLSPAVNQGILELARRGVIRRVSLMANTQFLNEGLSELKAIPGIQLGMHFNLTYGRALSSGYQPRSPRSLFFQALSPLKKSKLFEMIRGELKAQLEALRGAGVSIAYFDGHHHIHLVPGLIQALTPDLKAAGIRVVRVPLDPELKFTRKFPLVLLSVLARRAIRKSGFASLEVFYPQRAHFLDHGLMRARINRNPTAEVIVHPASHNDIDGLEFPDSYTEGRVDEFRALRMLGFLLSQDTVV